MKKSISLTIILFNFILQCNGQSITNSISTESFDNVEFDQISLVDIINTNGSQIEISNLISLPYEITEKGEPINELRRTFDFENNLLLTFKGLSTNQIPELIYVNASNLLIDGNEYSLGDYIDVTNLSYIINQTISGGVQILFSNSGGDCCLISITINSQSGIIERLEYIVYT